ncbi:MAG: FtsK/SpoIIIE domain-containing protein [Actinomycetaceae bacterium]|nr:FtsK/SpoIIIE domain-containing protein [Actinomycetaceae bacterium]
MQPNGSEHPKRPQPDASANRVGPQVRGATRLLSPGDVFMVGANLWEVRTRPESLDLTAATEYALPGRTARLRSWMLVLPLISLLWLVSRFIGGMVALAIAASLIIVGVYAWLAWRSRRKPRPRWGILYGLELPPRGAAARDDTAADEAGRAAFPSGAREAGRPAFRPATRPTVQPATRPAAHSAVRAATRPATQPAVRPALDDWIIDFSEAPTCKSHRLRIPILGTFMLVIPRFRRGRSIHTGPPADIALHDGQGWTEWVLAQALVHARLAGIAAVIRPDSPSVLRDADDTPLLTVKTTPGAADHLIQCPPNPPPRISAPTTSAHEESGTPSSVLISELPSPTDESAGLDAKAPRGLCVPIGVYEGEVAWLDLVHDGPHALVAGTTGSGKSEALRTWIAQMCRARDPRSLRLVLIDYKGGAAFGDLAQSPHAEGLLTDLNPSATARAIAGLAKELSLREEALAARGLASLDAWEATDPASAPARIVCVIDEFRAMIRTHPDMLDDLVDLAARGRSLGMHLIAATQSPGGVVTPAMRANLTLRVCLRTADASDSMEVLGVADAALLPRIPGRGIIDAGEPRVVQWAYSPREQPLPHATAGRSVAPASASPVRGPASPGPLSASAGSVGYDGAGELTAVAVPAGAVTGPLSAPSGSAAAPLGVSPALDGPRAVAASDGPRSAPLPTLWKPELPATIKSDVARRLLPAGDSGSPVFAIADDIHAREYHPLELSAEPVAIVGPAKRRAVALQAAAQVSHALVVETAKMQVNDVAHALDEARVQGRAVVVDDLGEFLRAADSWGMGEGQSWWRDWLRRHRAGVIVGVDGDDYGLVRSWSRALLGMPASQTRALALPRDVADLAKDQFVAYPWDGQPVTPVSIIAAAEPTAEGAVLGAVPAGATDATRAATRVAVTGPAPASASLMRGGLGARAAGDSQMVTPAQNVAGASGLSGPSGRSGRLGRSGSELVECAELVEPLVASSSMLKELERRVRRGGSGWVGGEVGRVDVLGNVDTEMLEVLERACRDAGATLNGVAEGEVLTKGYRSRAEVAVVVGELSKHALRTLKIPPYIRADSAESCGTWVGFCDVWYRLVSSRT